MKRISLFLLLLTLVCGERIATAQQLPRVAPEQVGMDSRHLQYADQAIRRAIAEDGIPGAVLAVVRHGRMAYLKAYGNRSVYPDTVPMTTDAIFDMASCSKAMSTAISTLILAERGQLRLLDAVNLYLPEFKNWVSPDGRERQTIRVVDLMTHTSGLPPYAPTDKLVKESGMLHPEALQLYIDTCARDFRPQTDFQYSCLNYITLQHIIEKVSGMSLRDFARQHIFDVLGMEHTDYLPCRVDKQGHWVNTADAHWAVKGEDWHARIAPTEVQPDGQVLCGQVHDPLARVMNGGVSGNAGVFSTAGDIAILCAALQNGGEWNGRRILSPLTVQAMRTVPRATASLGRTLGWDCFTAYASNNGDFFSPHTYSHAGYTGTSIVIDPDTDTSVILLINAVHPKDEHGVVRLRSLVANAVAASIICDGTCGSTTGASANPSCRNLAKYTDHYYRRFVQFMDEPEVTPQDIVMLGNSLTENGGDWSHRLQCSHVLNRGIIGDCAAGVMDRLHQILPGHPRQICLMIGVNDLANGCSPDSIAGMISQILERIHAESPQTKVCLQSLLPFNESFGRYARLEGKTELVPQTNQLLKKVARQHKVEFINLFPLFTEDKKSSVLRADLSTDGLHLNEAGYQIWQKALKAHLVK